MSREPAKRITCGICRKPIPTQHFTGATPERQAVFVERDGKRMHVECAAAEKRKST